MEFLTAVAVFRFDVSRLSVYFRFEEDEVRLSISYFEDGFNFVELFEEGRLFRSCRSSSFCERRCVRCGFLTKGFFGTSGEDVPEELLLGSSFFGSVLPVDGCEGLLVPFPCDVDRFPTDFEDVACAFPFADERDGLDACVSVEDDCDCSAAFCISSFFCALRRVARAAGLGIDISGSP